MPARKLEGEQGVVQHIHVTMRRFALTLPYCLVHACIKASTCHDHVPRLLAYASEEHSSHHDMTKRGALL